MTIIYRKKRGETPLDADGQPLNRNFSAKRLTHRTIDELIGLCKGIQADGVVHPDEARFLANWLKKSRGVIRIWPATILNNRIKRIFLGGAVDEDEAKELLEVLYEITGCKPSDEIIDKTTGEIIENLTYMSTLLPLDEPAPPVEFKDKSFCLTGKFCYGPRKKCETEILKRGGKIWSTPVRTDYLVLGLFGSRDWKHSTHGLKIKNAIELKEKGQHISIISEEHWAKHL
ncbi:MAG: BRCT domain-containing protein [Deltaproteobacteria bacterium]|nr:BRCT domain-containing protein [Deltaproteobacteria bacterium]